MPDLSKPLVKLNAIADRAASWSIVRVLLAVVAFDVLFFALKALILADEADATAHAARHLGAFSFAYGVGLLVVVVRPARARTMLPVAAVLAGALFITAVIDLSNGTVPLTGEATHLPELHQRAAHLDAGRAVAQTREARGPPRIVHRAAHASGVARHRRPGWSRPAPPPGAAGCASPVGGPRGRPAGRCAAPHTPGRPIG